MLELLFCVTLTVLPDYLIRRHVQGKRFGHEITLYSVRYELRYGITGCAILTVSLITLIFCYHPSTTNVTSFFRTVTILPEAGGRAPRRAANVSPMSTPQPSNSWRTRIWQCHGFCFFMRSKRLGCCTQPCFGCRGCFCRSEPWSLTATKAPLA